MTSQILKPADFTKTQKSRYLENETLFLLQIKKIINRILRANLWQKIVLQFSNLNNSAAIRLHAEHKPDIQLQLPVTPKYHKTQYLYLGTDQEGPAKEEIKIHKRFVTLTVSVRFYRLKFQIYSEDLIKSFNIYLLKKATLIGK